MPRRKFSRDGSKYQYRKLFILAVEGRKTEPEYFSIFSKRQSPIRVKCLNKKSDSSPLQVLKQMNTYIKKENLKPSDEAWLVIDKDHWEEHQLDELHKWTLKKDNYYFALSNPNFEYWLLLHFESGNKIVSAQEYTTRLKKHLPNYDKSIDAKTFTNEKIYTAVSNARQRDNPPCTDWPRNPGSTVYKLIEKLR